MNNQQNPKQFPHERYSPEWERAANRQARDFAPEIRACHDCGAPYVSGYCCRHCGSCNPSGSE